MMMDQPPEGLTDFLNRIVGGGGTSIIAATIGRAVYLSSRYRKSRRRIGWEVLWELPIAFGMAMIGEALASYFALSPTVATGLVATLAYLGPVGAQDVIERIFGRRAE